MVRTFAHKIVDAKVEVACGAGRSEGTGLGRRHVCRSACSNTLPTRVVRPTRVCTTRLVTVVVHVHDPALRRDRLRDLIPHVSWREPASAKRAAWLYCAPFPVITITSCGSPLASFLPSLPGGTGPRRPATGTGADRGLCGAAAWRGTGLPRGALPASADRRCRHGSLALLAWAAPLPHVMSPDPGRLLTFMP
jgi:hypothetical protein